MCTTKEYILKNYALNQWLSEFENPVECFDALMDCGENEEQFEQVCQEYKITKWEYVEDWYFELLIQQILDTYEFAIRLNKALSEVTA